MSEMLDFQRGREARMDCKPRGARRNADWLRGWDQVDADERRWAGRTPNEIGDGCE